MKYGIGIDIGGTKTAVVLGRLCENLPADKLILEKESFETKASGTSDEVIRQLKHMICRILDKRNLDRKDIFGIGISCGGPLDSERGIILNPPNLSGWNHIPVKNIMEEEFLAPAALENDANACAVAEWKYGAGRGFQNVIFLTFGTGMGAGLILNGRLYRGANGMAGEVGHVRLEQWGPEGFGKAGSFEGFCSGGGIRRLSGVSAKELAAAAEQNDPLALQVYRLCGQQLGKGLAILVDILNPERIIIGSIFQRSGHLLWPHAEPVLKKEALGPSLAACRVVPAQLGESIGDIAALSMAEYAYSQKGKEHR